jgi:hypothetical protein
VAQSKILTSAKVKLFINGKVFGQASSFRFSSETAHNDYYGIDNQQPVEFIPTVTRVSGSLTCHRMVADIGAEGNGLTAPFPVLPKAKYFSVSLVEIETDIVIFEAPRCVLINQSWGYDATRPAFGDLSSGTRANLHPS